MDGGVMKIRDIAALVIMTCIVIGVTLYMIRF